MTSIAQVFGTYSLNPPLNTLLKWAQNCPQSWAGRRMALALRKITLLSYAGNIVDAEVEGVRARFHLNDNVSERKYLFTPQFFDAFERQIIAENLPKNGTFVDIGANAGLYTLTASKYLGAHGHCLSIEPNPAVRVRLENNIAFNNFKNNITVAPYGVSDVAGQFKLYLGQGNLGGSSLIQGQNQCDDGIDVKCYPLTDILENYNISKIDILKIDIEGAENSALRPFFEESEASIWPRFIIIENSPEVKDSGLIGFLQQGPYQYELLKETRMNFVLARNS